VQGLYRDWLRSSYQDIGRFNREHGTRYEGFSAASAPKSRDWHFSSPAQWLAFQDWVRFKEWYGAAVLKEYAGILTGLGVKVPLYHNAGMLEDQAPMAFAPLAQELWLGVNFWLPRHPLNSFSSYVQGVRRLKQLKGSQPDRPSIVPELNWGWGTPGEFDFLARYTMPFSRGSNVYVLADSLHAGRFEGRPYSTIRQPYPGDAPIDSRGNPRPSYWLLARLIGFTRSEGAGLAEALPPASIALGSYLPYNAPALYTEFSRVRQSELAKVYSSAIAANAFLQQFMEGFISRDAEYRVVDLQRSGSRELAASGLLIVLSQEVMDAATQALLVWYVLQGGTLVLLPTVPSLDLELQPATVLRDALLPGLSWRQEKPARGSERLYFEGYEGPVQGRPPTQVLSGLPAGSRVLGRTGSGEPVALEKAAGRGRLILLAAYASDPDFYLWLAARQGYVARWAWSDDPQVEVVPLVNRQRGDSYLFVVRTQGAGLISTERRPGNAAGPEHLHRRRQRFHPGRSRERAAQRLAERGKRGFPARLRHRPQPGPGRPGRPAPGRKRRAALPRRPGHHGQPAASSGPRKRGGGGPVGKRPARRGHLRAGRAELRLQPRGGRRRVLPDHPSCRSATNFPSACSGSKIRAELDSGGACRIRDELHADPAKDSLLCIHPRLPGFVPAGHPLRAGLRHPSGRGGPDRPRRRPVRGQLPHRGRPVGGRPPLL
jgi:hypothetical protein